MVREVDEKSGSVQFENVIEWPANPSTFPDISSFHKIYKTNQINKQGLNYNREIKKNLISIVDANVAIRIFGGLDNTLADTSLTPSLESELEMLHSNTSFLQ